MKKLQDLDYRILFELARNCRISDRMIARRLGVSQPTVTRRRASLEKEGYVTYAGVPDFAKIGLTIMSFNFVRGILRAKNYQMHAQKITSLK